MELGVIWSFILWFEDVSTFTCLFSRSLEGVQLFSWILFAFKVTVLSLDMRLVEAEMNAESLGNIAGFVLENGLMR